MNYIYDLLLNFNKEFYDFYDWNNDDRLTHIRRIPIYKINEKSLKDIIYHDVRINKNFLKQIFNQTDFFMKNNLRTLKYACLLCNDKKVIGIKCDDNGRIIGKSDLLIDEHNEIISVSDRYDVIGLDYTVIKTNNIEIFKTRKKIMMEKYVVSELERQSTERLQYLLYECSNVICEDRNSIIEIIKKNVENNNIEQIYSFLKLVNSHKSV